MTPTFVEDERGVLVFGHAGRVAHHLHGPAGILEYVDSPQLDLERVVGAPRFHHQYLPDRVQYEPAPYAMAAEWVEALKAMGHTVEQGSRPLGQHAGGVRGQAHAARPPPTTIRAARPGCCSEGLRILQLQSAARRLRRGTAPQGGGREFDRPMSFDRSHAFRQT